jgi:flagellar P-ring protein precursor FlgI
MPISQRSNHEGRFATNTKITQLDMVLRVLRACCRPSWLAAATLLAGMASPALAQTETLAFPRNEPIAGAARLKDVASIQGVSDTPLIGYGLVVGLNKTGDKRQTIFSAQTLANMLERFGIAVSPGEIKIENVAAVLVTSQLGPYAQSGARLDVTVSSIGDARSLQGGTLVPTPLRGPDGSVVALAQGPLSLGGFGADGGAGNSVQVNHLTVGRVPGGALLQASRPSAMPTGDTVRWALHEPDFISANRVARAINMELGADAASVVDAGAVAVTVPGEYHGHLPDLIARLEPLSVETDAPAKVVISERTGTVVMGGDVRIGTAAVAHGNLSVRISTQYQVSQPQPLSQGQTTVIPQTDVKVNEGDAKLVTLDAGATLGDVVRALNLLGATPRDIIAVMQALKAAGALRAEIVIL